MGSDILKFIGFTLAVYVPSRLKFEEIPEILIISLFSKLCGVLEVMRYVSF